MTDDEKDNARDEGLGRLLKEWSPPPVPKALDDRVLAAYRKEFKLTPWRRLFGRRTSAEGSRAQGMGNLQGLLTVSVRVPLPVLLMATVLFLFAVAYALRPTPPSPTAVAPLENQAAPLMARGEPPVVTSTSLAGFRPVSEVTATVVSETTP
jgi:hypothetical protein